MPTILFSNGKNYRSALFSFIPKTGGTALLEFFTSIGGKVFLSRENNSIAPMLKCPTQHMHYEMLNSIYRLEVFNFSFAIVRNPIDRAKSDYLWHFRKNGDASSLPDFDHWLDFMLSSFRSNQFIVDNHIRPQHEFAGPMIKKIYRYEDGLQSIALDVLASLGLSPKKALPPVPMANTAEQHFGEDVRSSDVEISENARRRLISFYRKDFESYYPHLL